MADSSGRWNIHLSARENEETDCHAFQHGSISAPVSLLILWITVSSTSLETLAKSGWLISPSYSSHDLIGRRHGNRGNNSRADATDSDRRGLFFCISISIVYASNKAEKQWGVEQDESWQQTQLQVSGVWEQEHPKWSCFGLWRRSHVWFCVARYGFWASP